ncbi:uncharacterized protein [Phyllobates terribilis]|uniref:uncharacterized protein n=1 Tax=Phyllobates terribilis TaxID=111132 RepID=UPI003CCAAA37
MAAEKRGHTSRPAQYILAENRNKGESPSLIVLPYRHATVMPCVTPMEQRLPNHQRKPSCHNSDIYRCNSGVLNLDRRTHMQRSSLTELRRITPTSANSRNVSSAPRGLVTYLQLCRPIIPRERTNLSGLRSHNQYIHRSSVDTLKHINLNPGLAVNGVPLGQVQPCSQNVPQGEEKVQFHVYLPYENQQSAEAVSSKFNSMNLQECKNPEDDKMLNTQNLA